MNNLSANDVFARFNKNIIKIVSYDIQNLPILSGSGVLLSKDNIIITNYHNIAGANSFKMFINSEEITNYGLIFFSVQKDIALFKINGLYEYPDIQLQPNYLIGEKIFTMGYPLKYGINITEGIISGSGSSIKSKIEKNNFTREIFHSTVINITAPISHGNSGGALFNTKGELIGITTYSEERGQLLNSAIPMSEILKIIDLKRIRKNLSSKTKIDAVHKVLIALNLMEVQDFNTAYKLLKKASSKLKNDYTLNLYMAMCLIEKDQFSKAVLIFKKLQRTNKYDVTVLHLLSIIYLHKRNFKEAKKIINLNIKHHPKVSTLYNIKAILYMRMNQYNKALEYVDKALEMETVPRYIYLKACLYKDIWENAGFIDMDNLKTDNEDFQNVMSTFELFLQYEPEDEEALFKYSTLLTHSHNYSEAKYYLTSLINKYNQNDEAFYYRAICHYNLNNIDDAINDLTTGLKIKPNSIDLLSYRARYYEEKMMLSEAIDDYKSIIKIEPNHIIALTNIGLIYLNYYSENDIALSYFMEVLKINSKEYYNNYYISQCLFNKGDYEEANKWINKIKRTKSVAVECYILSGQINFKLKNINKSLSDFNKSLELSPINIDGFKERANLFLFLNDFNSALNDARKIISINKEIPDGYILKAKIILNQKKYKDTISFVNKYLFVAPLNFEFYKIRGEAYMNLNDFENALIDFNKSIIYDDCKSEVYIARAEVCAKLNLFNQAISDLEKACLWDISFKQRVDQLKSEYILLLKSNT